MSQNKKKLIFSAFSAVLLAVGCIIFIHLQNASGTEKNAPTNELAAPAATETTNIIIEDYSDTDTKEITEDGAAFQNKLLEDALYDLKELTD